MGEMSNNKVEAYGLLLGLKILRDKKISNTIIFGDSSIIIQAMVSGNLPKNVALSQILHRSKHLERQIGGIDYYYILRIKNKQADSQANE